MIKAFKLEEPLHFKTTSTSIVIGHNVHDYSDVLSDSYKNKDAQVNLMKANYDYVDVPIKVGHWMLEWSSYDPQQCWVELLKLWVEGGIRIQLDYPQCHIEMPDDEEEKPCCSSFRGRLPKHQLSLKWSLYRSK